MTRTQIAGGAVASVVVLIVFAAGVAVLRRSTGDFSSKPKLESTPPLERPQAVAGTRPGFLYGRVTTVDGATLEGRLRWGGEDGQEAFWGDYFNGTKAKNSWAALVPPAQLPRRRFPVEVLGVTVTHRERPIDLTRFFLARFGDIARIEARGRDVRVILKSGTVFDLDRFAASDFDDGVRVWDPSKGVVDLDSLRIRSIELLPSPSSPGAAPARLYGTVQTRQGDFTGFLQWDREECLGSDTLDGRTDQGTVSLRFDTLHSITRRSRDAAVATQLDGREVELRGHPDVNHENRGVYVDDPRYGRVLVSWDAFERVVFQPADSGPAYEDFPPGRPLTGGVTTRSGRRLEGRLVFDLDESETTETLDAPSQGIDYTLPFGWVTSIVLGEGGARVTLQSGEELRLEPAGDLGPDNAGLLVFPEGRKNPEYVPWADVREIDLSHGP